MLNTCITEPRLLSRYFDRNGTQSSGPSRHKTLVGTFHQRAAIPAAALPLHVQVGISGFTAVVVVRPEMHMHNINKMVYVGIEPWHGLGVRLPSRSITPPTPVPDLHKRQRP